MSRATAASTVSTLSVVFFSGTGTTDLLAQAIGEGAASVDGVQVKLLRVTGEQIDKGRWQDDAVLEALSASDAIVFGSPTFMGGAAAPFKAFADATAGIWYGRGWVGKFAGGFTISGSPSGDKLHTLAYFNLLAAQHGMTWLNWNELPHQADGTNRLASFMGLMAQNGGAPGSPPALDPADALSAGKYGRYLAQQVRRYAAASQPEAVAAAA